MEVGTAVDCKVGREDHAIHVGLVAADIVDTEGSSSGVVGAWANHAPDSTAANARCNFPAMAHAEDYESVEACEAVVEPEPDPDTHRAVLEAVQHHDWYAVVTVEVATY